MVSAAVCACLSLRYDDHAAQRWLQSEAPCRWQGKIELEFHDARYAELQPAGSCLHAEVVRRWQERMRAGRRIGVPVVHRTEQGRLYLFDGNHRYRAMRECFGREVERLGVRVAILRPRAGYQFRHRQFATYATYVLETTPEWRAPGHSFPRRWMGSPPQRWAGAIIGLRAEIR